MWSGGGRMLKPEIIERHISSIVSTIISSTETTAICDAWTTLNNHLNATAQFELSIIKLKDHVSFDAYIGEFKTPHSCFIAMGVPFSKFDMVRLI